MRVAQLVDSLDPGGTERVAVQIANGLAQRGLESHLLTGRRDGALGQEVASSVHRHCLERRHRLSPKTVVRLARYLGQHRIDVLHAHSTSLFLAAAAALLQPRTRIVWHDHYGSAASEPRNHRIYALAARRVDAVVSVNRDLQRWATDDLGVPSASVHYLANWISPRPVIEETSTLAGATGGRIVCVANLRPQKAHDVLLKAFDAVRASHPKASLSLVGAGLEGEHGRALQSEVARLELTGTVHFLGVQRDVPSLLDQADVGVLSSLSEGLPLALLEYGQAALPTVVTAVGDCDQVVEHEVSGLLVEPGNETALAEALVRLLKEPETASAFGRKLRRKVEEAHSPEAGFDRLEGIYGTLTEAPTRVAA